jgi:hypothetical protein
MKKIDKISALKSELNLHRSLLSATSKGLKECAIELETERNKNRLLLQQRNDALDKVKQIEGVIQQAQVQTSVIADQEKIIKDLRNTIYEICSFKINGIVLGEYDTIGQIISKLKKDG